MIKVAPMVKVHWLVKLVAGTLLAASVTWAANISQQVAEVKEVNATQTQTDVQTLLTLQRIDATLVRMEDHQLREYAHSRR